MNQPISNRTGLWRYLVSQFGNPRGPLGSLAGFIMAHRESNRARNRWTVDLLRVTPGARVLEIGCGPGLSLATLAERATEGLVVGVDRSSTMLAQAARRNRQSIERGRVVLRQGDIESGVDLGAFVPFDHILLVNVVMFFERPVDTLGHLRQLLREGGTIAITHQPRSPKATHDDALRAAEAHLKLLRSAGFENAHAEVLPLEPVAATCALGGR